MLRAVRKVTMYIPTTGLIFRYSDKQFAVNLLNVSAFLGHLQGRSQKYESM
jgi:hypothetical protein